MSCCEWLMQQILFLTAKKIGPGKEQELTIVRTKKVVNERVFKFFALPIELRFTVIKLIHETEASVLMKVNKSLRFLMLHKGLHPKYVDEIYVEGPRQENLTEDTTEFILHFTLLFRRTDSALQIEKRDYQKAQALFPLSIIYFPNRPAPKYFWKQLSQIRFCRKLFINTWLFDANVFKTIIAEMQEERIFSNLEAFQFIHIQSSLSFAEKLFENFRPNFVEEFGLFINPATGQEDEIEKLYQKVLTNPVIKECKYLNLLCSTINQWKVFSQFHSEHLRFGCYRLIDLFNVLDFILANGLPQNDRLNSFTLQFQIVLNDPRHHQGIFQEFQSLLAQASLRSADCTENALEKIKKLYSRGSACHLFNTFHTFALRCPIEKIRCQERENWGTFSYQFFPQKQSEKDYFVALFLQSPTLEAANEHKFTIVWAS